MDRKLTALWVYGRACKVYTISCLHLPWYVEEWESMTFDGGRMNLWIQSLASAVLE